MSQKTPIASSSRSEQEPVSEVIQSTRSRNYGSIEPTAGETSNTTTPSSSISVPNSGSSTPEQMRSSLSFLQKFGFGLGHVYNDLCAGVWFSYTLLFMQAVLGLPATEAGTLVMLGQVSDAISTPIVGLLADRYGTKRKWHIFGTGLVFVAFPMIFSICPFCDIAPSWWPPIYFTIYIVLFQFAWAVVQITHLAMIPEMSKTMKDRADLTATRYSASVISNVVVYMITWAVLQGRSKLDNNIGPADAYRFRDISLILTLIGVSMSVIFHFSLAVSDYEARRLLSLAAQQARNTSIQSTDAPAASNSAASTSQETDKLLDAEAEAPPVKIRQQKNFLKSPKLYQNAFLYVFSRLFMTTSLVYMPLWLDERSWSQTIDISSDASVDHLATVPLVSFLASFIASMGLKQTNRWVSHQMAYFIGSLISIAGCVWIAYATPATASSIKLFAIAVLFGAGSSITMISSLCITADMIGTHTYQGGFIYSAVTFADKLITGIVVVIIEAMKCSRRSDCPEYYRNVLAYACGVASTLGILTLLTLRFNRRRPRLDRRLYTT